MAVVFTGTDATRQSDPTPQYVEHLIRSAGRTYWHGGSATADLRWDDGRAYMVLVVDVDHGVMVIQSPRGGEDEQVYTDPDGDEDDEVDLYPGGNEITVPGTWLVPVDQAMVVIRRFLQDGGRHEPERWVSFEPA